MKLSLYAVALMPCLLVATSCSHPLEVMNLHDYQVPVQGQGGQSRMDLAVVPANVDQNAVWLANAVRSELASHSAIRNVSTAFDRRIATARFDYLLAISPRLEYGSSGWNFLVNFPGGFLFAPFWHGYSYEADISTAVKIEDSRGRVLKELVIPTPYYFRHSEIDRTWWPIFQFSIYTALGGFYTAFSYDEDATPEFERAVRENYAKYVVHHVLGEIRSLQAAR